MTKQKWIMAIACGLVVGILSFVWNSWQSGGNRAEAPEMPVVSPPPIEQPVESEAPASTDVPAPTVETSIVGTWVGTVDYGIGPRIMELMLDESGSFYSLEYINDEDWFHVFEGTYTISDSRLQMTLQWVAAIDERLDNGYDFHDIFNESSEIHISIVGNTMYIDNFNFGLGITHEAVLTRGIPSGLWGYEYRERLVNNSDESVLDNSGATEYYPGDWLRTFTDVTGYPLKSTRVTGYGSDLVEADILEYTYDYSSSALALYKEYLLSIGFTLKGEPRIGSGITSYEYIDDDIMLIDISHGSSYLWLIVRFIR
jgi:hypothetical protein